MIEKFWEKGEVGGGGGMGTPHKPPQNKQALREKRLRKENEARRVCKQLLLPAFLVTQLSRLSDFSPSFFAEGIVSVVEIITVT